MRKIIFIAFLAISTIYGQENPGTEQVSAKVGDELILGTPSAQKYQHIRFPKINFIIKKGGIANYKALKGKKVVITSIENTEKGKKVITIKRKDGLKFFNSITTVRVDLEKAITAGEIKS